MRTFRLLALTPPTLLDPAIAIAATRAGEMGVLNLEHARDEGAARDAIARMVRYARGACGVKLDSGAAAFTDRLIGDLPEGIELVILIPGHEETLHRQVSVLGQRRLTVLLEVTCPEHAELGEQLGVDGLVAKGHEAAGWVGEETAFILLQRLLSRVALPVWAYGGIGLHTAAACYAAGAAGVVLDSQLALTRESQLPEAVKETISAMDGSETVCLGAGLVRPYRAYSRPGMPAISALCDTAQGLGQGPTCAARTARWRQAVEARVGWGSPQDHVWPLGQDVCFAASLARGYRTVSGVLRAFREAVVGHIAAARATRPLDENAPLARSHGTRYPIAQGPMKRVSDRAQFALCVAQEGALPFLALGLMRAAEVRSLLEETQHVLQDRPWGVGILGFVPFDLRQEQMEVIRQYRTPFALIAGGRPDQARALEAEGIATYLHVPSPGLLHLFLQDGARRFVFEGRECGGHVGPQTSFVLWNTMLDVLLEELPADEMTDCHILFAGGIHDALSASMVAAMAGCVAERGANVGVLLGTAYVFTEEAVTSGAILPGFQDQALRCKSTVLMESGPGHSFRCVPTPYAELFEQQKARLLHEAVPWDEIRRTLEVMNVGRLRIASKGITRHPRHGRDPEAPKYVSVGEEEQYSQGLYMIGQLAALRDHTCTLSQLHREVAVEGSRRLEAVPVPDQLAFSLPPAQPAEIAIIGMSCILPKAGDLQTYWENILNKVNAISEVPRERWDWELYYDPDRDARDKVYSKWGGFIGDIAFDPVEFGMPPNSLASIDPMQLLALKTAQEALGDAGYLENLSDRSRISVILGASGGTGDLGAAYVLRASLPLLFGHRASDVVAEAGGILPEWTEDSFAGLLPNVAAGRIANRFDLGGSNYVVDAACASSLAAVRLAVKELESHGTDLVVVGGVDTVQSPFGYLCFSKTQALSPTGQVRTFDASADGIVIGEGVVMLVLKRLADAERDGDRIYAVIQGVGASSDGRAKGLTAPRPEGQIRALRRAYAEAGISPLTVELFEAHGTGTVVGDRAEALALSTFLEEAGAAPSSAAIGSVKTMIGHTKATAGVAALAKAALAVYHKVLPPTLGVKQPNPKARFRDGPLYINSETRPWIHGVDGCPRRAGVSAFGFGGTNFHAVIEEYTADFVADRQAALLRWPSELLLWSADSRQDLVSTLASLEQALERAAPPALSDLSYTLYKAFDDRRSLPSVCLAIVATCIDDLRQKLTQARQALSEPDLRQITGTKGIYYADEPLAWKGRVAFLFPGQGSQYTNMLRDLAICLPQVREAFEQTDGAIAGRFPRPLSCYIFPPPAFTPDEESAQEQALTQTDVAQPALGAASVALWRLLRDLGVSPDMVAGHSYGEYPALCAAGVLDTRTLAIVSEARGRAIVEAAEDDLGTMAAVRADVSAIAPIVEPIEGVWIANLNSPKQTIISGTREGVAEAVKRLTAERISAQPIAVACGFHSPLVAPAQQRLAEALSHIEFAVPNVEVYSNTTAGKYPDDPEAIRGLLAEHLVRPIRFVDQVEAMYGAGARVFVEVGPRNIVTRLVSQTLGDRPHVTVATDAPGVPGLTQLQHALGRLAAHGVPFRLERLFSGRCVRRLDLDALDKETVERPLSATTWLVNGGRAKPLHETASPPRTLPTHVPDAKAMVEMPVDEKDGGPASHRTGSVAETVHVLPPTLLPGTERPVRSGTTPLSDDGSDQVMLQYQQVMRRFLETQRNVMLAYLRGASGPAALPQPGAELRQAETQPDLPSSGLAAGTPELPPASADVRTGTPQVDAARSPTISPLSEPVAGRERLTERLFQIVSERTGYPPEMLSLDVDMEAELGIDSIKRVEILGALQQACALTEGRLGSEVMEQLTSIRTLGGILGWIEQALPTDGKREERADATMHKEGRKSELVSAPTLTAVSRSVLVAVDGPPLDYQPVRFPPDLFLITDDGHGVAQAIEEQIRSRGGRALRVQQGARTGMNGGGVYEADLTDATAVVRLVEALRGQYGAICGLVHALPLRPAEALETMDLAAWRGRLCRDVKSLYFLARAAAQDLERAGKAQGAWLIAATAMGGAFAVDAPSEQLVFPGQGGLSGLVKTLALEWPAVHCKVIDLDLGNAASTLAGQVIQEMTADDGRVEMGYRGSQRQVLQLREEPLGTVRPARLAIDSDWVVLVTGGARGITAEVACELAERYRPTLLLAGRSPLPYSEESTDTAELTEPQELKAALIEQMSTAGRPIVLAQVEAAYNRLLKEREMRNNIAKMRRAGATVSYRQVDVCDEQAMADLVAGIYRQYGRLDGVVHGAGVIEDKLIEDKTPDSFDRVFDTKADGVFILSRLLHPESLSFLAMFSSAAGLFGNRGQCDYAATNEVLNKLALHLDRVWPGRVVSINWGPWAKTGMVSAELRRQFAERGVSLISVSEGRRTFDRELVYGSKGEALVVVTSGKWGAGSPARTPSELAQSLPLLKNTSSLSEGASIRVDRILDPSYDLYLMDHRLDGKPVLPLAMAMELMAEVARQGWPDLSVVGLQDLRVLRGVVLEDGPRTIRVTARAQTCPSHERSGIDVTVEITDPQETGRSYYSAVVELADKPLEPSLYQVPFSDGLKPFPMTVGEAYRKWLFHGPLFRGIAEIRGITEHGMDAVLVPSFPQQCLADVPAGQWLIDPVVFDSGLQMIILWTRAFLDMTPLPARFRHFRLYAPLSGPEVRCYLVVPNGLQGHVFEVDVAFVSPDGRLLGLLEGMETPPSTALNRLAGGQ